MKDLRTQILPHTIHDLHLPGTTILLYEISIILVLYFRYLKELGDKMEKLTIKNCEPGINDFKFLVISNDPIFSTSNPSNVCQEFFDLVNAMGLVSCQYKPGNDNDTILHSRRRSTKHGSLRSVMFV